MHVPDSRCIKANTFRVTRPFSPKILLPSPLMLASRVAFVDSTNSWNQRSLPHSRPSFPPKFALSSRKCLPTCTVSLASASSTTANLNDLRISIDIDIAPSATSIIPFPSSSDTHSSISQPDPTCLLRSQPEPQLLNRSSSSRRKRLCQPIAVLKSATASVAAGTSCSSGQPPRKRPRLHKGAKVKKALHAGTGTGKAKAKGAWYLSTPELRFMAVLQRSVARGVLERQEPEFGGFIGEPDRRKSEFKRYMEAQDRKLASRLRTCLLERGFRDSDVVDLDADLRDRSDDVYINMDMEVDVGAGVSADDSPEPSPADSVGMDIDVEQQGQRLTLPPKPSRSRSQSTRCTPYRSPSPSPPPSTPPTLCHSQLVASLTMRYRSRVAVRSHGQSSVERMLSTEPRVRTVSPLARFEPYTEG